MRSEWKQPQRHRTIGKVSTFAALLALTCGVAAAQTTLKIGVINMQEALLSTKDGQKAVAALKAKFSPKEQEFQQRQAQLQTKQDQYRKTENTLSEEAKASLARDIDTMTKNLQRDTDDARQDVDTEQQRVLNELGQKMMQVLQKYATEKQLTMVMDISGQPNNILFASNTLDITRDVIAMYDAAPPATTVTAPKTTSSSAPKPASNPAPKAAAPASRPAAPAPK